MQKRERRERGFCARRGELKERRKKKEKKSESGMKCKKAS